MTDCRGDCGHQLRDPACSILHSALWDGQAGNGLLSSAPLVVSGQCCPWRLQHRTVMPRLVTSADFWTAFKSIHSSVHLRYRPACLLALPVTLYTQFIKAPFLVKYRYMPDVFKAVSPHYAFRYFLSSGRASWVSLTGIVLCISGSEATYADMGHFSHRAITVRYLLSLFHHISSFFNENIPRHQLYRFQ